ncbi:MAG TPA: protein translocase subunit SecF [Dermatophilaceae bacterium]|jgi:preprotein translocase subunit SecF|nr:protein translocase subunit SecF [Dermatophilaceae bacterium]
MFNLARFGNELYSGDRSIDFVGRRRTWYVLSGVFLTLAAIGLIWKGLVFGLEFRGGSEFRVSEVSSSAVSNYEGKAKDAVSSVESGIPSSVTKVGSNTVRVQTEKLNAGQSADVRTALAKAFNTDESRVSASFVGPSWGASVSQKALKALLVFLALVSLVMAIYFRTWKMAVAGLVALLHDLVITVGIYALFGFEVTPASMIGFLTILGYSLYDTVVVFDKVRENTTEALGNGRMSYTQAANLAVNQTLVRSINTTVVALLPIASILFVGFTLLGPGTLLDLALALFVGIAVGAYSSIFIATPLLAQLRRGEPAVRELAKRAARFQAKNARGTAAAAEPVPAVADGDVGGAATEPRGTARTEPVTAGRAGAAPRERELHPYARGPRNQPKRNPKSRR